MIRQSFRAAAVAAALMLAAFAALFAAASAMGTFAGQAAPSAAVSAPTNTVKPTISSPHTPAQVGDTVTVSNGSWTPAPASFHYQWYDCDPTWTTCNPIASSYGHASYTVQSSDLGSLVWAKVGGCDASGSCTWAGATNNTGVVAAATTGVPTNTAAPTISGGNNPPQTGDALTTTNGSWTNSPTSFHQQWKDCDSAGSNCVLITNSYDQNPYTVQSADVGHTIRSNVQACNASGCSAWKLSAATGVVVAAVTGPPANTAAPAVSGTAQQGSTLTTTDGTWTNSPTSFAYAWQDCDSSGANCTTIAGASAKTYVLQASDVGFTVESVVTASNSAGAGSPATSAPTAVVTAPPPPTPPSNTTVPAVSGTPQQGNALTVSNGSWSGDTPMTFTYQWQDCVSGTCSDIAGATSKSYTLQASDVGDTVRANVKATNDAGSATATSNAVGPVTVNTTPTVKHIVWIAMENQSYSAINNSTSDPYIHSLMSQYGSATNMWAAYHPSLPNYLDMTSGSNQGISTDCSPASGCQTGAASIFSQLSGGAARGLAESMPSNCDKSNSGNYAVRHNPYPYYTNAPVPADCASYDVPLNSTAPDLSAKFTFITPNLCHDMHSNSCTGSTDPIAQGDNWLKSFVPTLLSSSQYQAGNTAIFITWDEGDFSVTPSQVATLIIDPWGAHDTSSCQGVKYDHHSMLQYAEQTFGVAKLGPSANSMAGCFGLPTPPPPPPPPGSLCGQGGTAPATYKHVIWMIMENQSASNVYGNPTGKTPYWNTLTQQCGSSPNMHGEFKPSAPNYVAIASGSNQGLTSDNNPAKGGSFSADNILNQVQTSGGTWREYSSRMPSNCDPSNSSDAYFTAHHMIATYFKDIYSNPAAQDCLHWHISLNPGETGPLCGAPNSTAGATTPAGARDPANCSDTKNGTLAKDLVNNTLPTLSIVSPADDGGNSTLGGEVDPTLGDAFTQRWIAKIQASQAYQSGSTAIFLTWDENGCFTSTCISNPTTPTIPTMVIAPTVPAGVKPSTSFNHYSILHATQEMLGLPTNLTTADSNATGMRAAFGL